jgi:hypothetical protein
LIQEGKKGLEPGSVGACRVELDSGGKHSRLMEALKAFSLAFSRLSCSVSFLTSKISFSIRSLSFLTRKISISVCLERASISRTGRQLSIDKNDRHRGSDERDAPFLGEGEGAPGDGEVVIGGEEGDQAKSEATGGLGETEPVEAKAIEARQGASC